MKKLVILVIALALLVALLPACAAPAPTPTQVIELDLNLHIPPTHWAWAYCVEPWAKELSERTGGQVKVVPHFASSLAPLKEGYDAVLTGLADMAEGLPIIIQSGRWPLIEMADYLRLYKREVTMGRATWQIYQKYPAFQVSKAVAEV